jgi:hypothetical protein
MNVLCEIDFKQGKEYFAKLQTVYGGNQYKQKILEISNLSLNLGDDKDFQVSAVTIKFDDSDDHFNDILASEWNKYISGISVELYQEDGTAIRKLYLQDWILGAGFFQITASDDFEELNNNIIEVIDENFFPDAAVDEAYNQPINRIYRNNSDLTTTAYMKCWRVERGTDLDFLVSSNSVSTLTYVEDSGGVDRTGVSALIDSGGYTYLTYNGTDDYVLVNVSEGTDSDPYDVIVDIMGQYFTNFGGSTFADANLSTFLTRLDYTQYYAIGEQKTGRTLLKDIGDSYGLEWIVNSDREIEFKWIDFLALTKTTTFKQSEIDNFDVIDYDSSKIKNKINTNFALTNHDSTYIQSHQFDKKRSQDNWRTSVHNLNLNYIDFRVSGNIPRSMEVHKTYKRLAILNKNPRIICIMTLPIDKFISREPGELIGVTHEDAISTSERLYQIRNIDFDFMGDIATVIMWDYEYLNDLRSADKFLLQSNTFNNSTLFFDDAVDGWANIGFNIPEFPHHKTAEKKFQDSSIYFDTDEHLTITTAVADTFSMSQNTNFTCDFWFNHDALGSIEPLVIGGVGGQDFWIIEKTAADTINFQHQVGGADDINITSVATVPSAGDWHHLALIKVSGEIGVYLNETQILYSNAGLSELPEANKKEFAIARDESLTNYFTGYMEEVRITHDNYFNAAPNVGLTDTIKAPVEPHNDESVYNATPHLLSEDYFHILDENDEYILDE